MNWKLVLWFLAGWLFSLVFAPSKVLGMVGGARAATS